MDKCGLYSSCDRQTSFSVWLSFPLRQLGQSKERRRNEEVFRESSSALISKTLHSFCYSGFERVLTHDAVKWMPKILSTQILYWLSRPSLLILFISVEIQPPQSSFDLGGAWEHAELLSLRHLSFHRPEKNKQPMHPFKLISHNSASELSVED